MRYESAANGGDSGTAVGKRKGELGEVGTVADDLGTYTSGCEELLELMTTKGQSKATKNPLPKSQTYYIHIRYCRLKLYL